MEMLESLLPVVSALIGAALGGIIGFLGSYLIQRRIWGGKSVAGFVTELIKEKTKEVSKRD